MTFLGMRMRLVSNRNIGTLILMPWKLKLETVKVN